MTTVLHCPFITSSILPLYHRHCGWHTGDILPKSVIPWWKNTLGFDTNKEDIAKPVRWPATSAGYAPEPSSRSTLTSASNRFLRACHCPIEGCYFQHPPQKKTAKPPIVFPLWQWIDQAGATLYLQMISWYVSAKKGDTTMIDKSFSRFQY